MTVNITKSARERINFLCQSNNKYAVSLNVRGGGCAGFEYDWGFVDSPKEIRSGDEFIETDESRVVIGRESIMFLIGSTIDYKEKLFGSTFEINNPLAKSSCGCGTSVSF